MTHLLHDFDHAELSKYLSDHVLDFTGLDTVTRFSGGQSNPTYKIT
ncbi:MAG: aminoglycoside phosphotransferase (APT) family kinase protein, partial [Reinekea sp.]